MESFGILGAGFLVFIAFLAYACCRAGDDPHQWLADEDSPSGLSDSERWAFLVRHAETDRAEDVGLTLLALWSEFDGRADRSREIFDAIKKAS